MTHPDKSQLPKEYFLFVGTLNRRKGLDKLLFAYLLYSRILGGDSLPLLIVGDGDEKTNLVNMVKSYALDHKIIFLGRIESQKRLKELFLNSLALLHYSQAGLSVLQSFAYGTPVLCHIHAISGGETSNIIDSHNGFLIHDPVELSSKMRLLTLCPDLLDELSTNSYLTYTNKASFDSFVNVFLECMS